MTRSNSLPFRVLGSALRMSIARITRMRLAGNSCRGFIALLTSSFGSIRENLSQSWESPLPYVANNTDVALRCTYPFYEGVPPMSYNVSHIIDVLRGPRNEILYCPFNGFTTSQKSIPVEVKRRAGQSDCTWCLATKPTPRLFLYEPLCGYRTFIVFGICRCCHSTYCR